MFATHRQTACQALDRGLIHRLLLGTIRTHHPGQKHRQRLCRWKQPFQVFGQQRLHRLNQFWAGKKIEKGIAITV
jgi:hypothetical protein